MPKPVEAAVYFVVSEALTNTAKHANAPLVKVDLRADNGTVDLEIDDDGVGGADPARGSGLIGLRDRVEALDADGLLRLVREHRPELVVVDIRMPPRHATEGLDAARIVREELPETAIVVLSAHVEVEQAMELLEAASASASGRAAQSRTLAGDALEQLKRGTFGRRASRPQPQPPGLAAAPEPARGFA